MYKTEISYLHSSVFGVTYKLNLHVHFILKTTQKSLKDQNELESGIDVPCAYKELHIPEYQTSSIIIYSELKSHTKCLKMILQYLL